MKLRKIIFFLSIFSGVSITVVNNSAAVPKLTPHEKRNIEVYQNNSHSTVHVINIALTKNFFFGPVEEIPRGAGSGFVWDKKGHIVTNYHVAHGGDRFQVYFKDNPKPYRADYVGGGPRKDIAVLKLKEIPPHLRPVTVGNSGNLQTGQSVIAIGNPFGFDHSMSAGVVSATGRQITGIGGVKIHDMIQTDAAINLGNSGGPLLNSSGELIGMNTQIISPNGGSSGLGFAVPVDTIKTVVPQIITHGRIIRPVLDIIVLKDSIKNSYGIDKGVMIQNVLPGGPAQRAGLQGISRDPWGRLYMGDIITAIDDKEVNSLDEIYHILENYKVDDVVEISYRHTNQTKKIRLKLSANEE
jgi:S1-C subfamily serine protease